MIRRLIAETISDIINEAHPSITRAFETGRYPLGEHPIFKKHGQKLSKEQYAHLKDQYKQRTGAEELNPHDLMRTFHQIQQLEAAHKEQLERIAKDIVTKVWKIDPSLIEKGEITPDVDLEPSVEEEEPEELTPEQKAEVEKRIIMNALTHGSAIHMMTTMYHLGREALDRIDKRLVPLYDRFSTGAVLSSWYQDIEALLQLIGIQLGGAVQIDWEKDTPTIKAQAVMFPLLLHELSKGVMELLTAHQLSPLDPDTLKKVYKHADKYEHEFFHFFVGPALWRKFLRVVPKDRLAETVAALSRLEPKKVEEIINTVVDNPDAAKEILASLVED